LAQAVWAQGAIFTNRKQRLHRFSISLDQAMPTSFPYVALLCALAMDSAGASTASSLECTTGRCDDQLEPQLHLGNTNVHASSLVQHQTNMKRNSAFEVETNGEQREMNKTADAVGSHKWWFDDDKDDDDDDDDDDDFFGADNGKVQKIKYHTCDRAHAGTDDTVRIIECTGSEQEQSDYCHGLAYDLDDTFTDEQERGEWNTFTLLTEHYLEVFEIAAVGSDGWCVDHIKLKRSGTWIDVLTSALWFDLPCEEDYYSGVSCWYRRRFSVADGLLEPVRCPNGCSS